MGEMDEIVKEFVFESNENLDQLDRDFVELERDPKSREILARVFRTLHTIKGATGFLGFANLGAVAHVGETLLSHLRDGRLVLDSEITTGLLSLMDAIRHMLSEIGVSGKEGDADYTPLIETLTEVQRVRLAGERPGPPISVDTDVPLSEAKTRNPLSPTEEVALTGASTTTASRPTATHDAAGKGGLAYAFNSGESETQGDAQSQPLESSSLRVHVQQLDKLMDLVGELVLTRNQMLQLSNRQQDPALIVSSQRLNLITSELQESVAKTRMQPIDSIWQKFPRLVRDLAIQCRKKVRLEMTGNQTELDKTVLEAIKGPLTHLVRNAIGHGIESSETRASAGKPAEGRVELRAFHENGQVNIELSDDGAGINLARVRQKAVDNHLVVAEESHLMADKDILELIFLPGFSTAETVTTVSGRGVGMDVVRTNIERVGGSVAIESCLGTGTTVRIRIPLTLAIIPALIVSAGKELYALPQRNVVELLHLDEMERKRQIDRIQGVAGCRLRGRLLPLVFLDAELQLQQQVVNLGTREPRGTAGTVVVLEAQGQPFGLVVDQVIETQEIVVKPLGRLLKAVSIFAGATILGDGRVALILDVKGLARHASVVETADGRTPVGTAVASEELAQQLGALLVFEGLGERVGIPISQVTRLEEFLRSAVETTEGREVLQYRNEILPLFAISELLFDGSRDTRTFAKRETGSDKISVVVCSQSGSAVGLVVDRVVDIVEHDFGKLGSSGRAVIQGRVTQILDLKKILPSTLLPKFTSAGLEV